MDDLIAFLRARLDEDEKIGTAIFRDHTWSAYPEGGNDGWAIEGAHSGEPSCIVGDKAMATHIARHDPARVLADVAAKRAIIDRAEELYESNTLLTPAGDALGELRDVVLPAFALPYVDHPGYREEWRP